MTRHLALLAAASLGAIAFAAAAEGSGGNLGSPAADTSRVAYIVHKEGEAATLELSPSGRVLTESFERPEWAGNVVLAMLAERNAFYQSRLGADLAAPLVETNIINYDDLNWVALDDDQMEVEIAASDEYRQQVLATALGIDLETGDIDGAIVDHYIDRDNKGYTLEEIATRADTDEVFGKREQANEAQG